MAVMSSHLKFLSLGVITQVFAASLPLPNLSWTWPGNVTGTRFANCVGGPFDISVTGTNTKILQAEPANNMAATELFVEIDQANSTLVARSNGGNSTITGTYQIYGKFCFPRDQRLALKVVTLQFLTHGGTLDNTYWDLGPNNSYIDAATKAGYATFSYDRLGTGKSDHPDPIQVVQASLQIELAHLLVQGIRETRFAGRRYKNVIGVSHSLGSGLSVGQTSRYPEDFDAVILTGISTEFTFVATGTASTAMQIANTDPSNRFTGLANGYFTPAPVEQAIQFAFYRYPYYDQQVFNAQVANKQTNALGEIFTLASAYVPAPAFTGPVFILNGQNDFFYCGGDCAYPTDQAASVIPAFFPAASKNSTSYLVPNTGHSINAHTTARQAFDRMTAFIQANGFV
ncbi:MAG: hypothetical protein LQ352_005272 [Teloschistes flavicans]|nr:MAG: hypothetical protein LQ352_005272 [Teloschistes flavicans]